MSRRFIDTKLAEINDVADRLRQTRIERTAFVQNLFQPKEWVPVSDVLVGDDGSVLLRRNDWESSSVQYALFRPSSTTPERFVLPMAQSVKAVRGNMIWSLVEQEDGDLQLIRLTLSRKP